MIRAFLLPIALRLALMLSSLLAVQLTYSAFSPDLFFAFNMLIFLVGLHTALSYPVQVEIWETGQVAHAKLGGAVLIGAAIVLGVALFISTLTTFFLPALAYLLYRFSDRLSFNVLITRGQVMSAYGISIATIVVEITVFWALATHASENIARLLAPSLIAGAIPTIAYILRTRSISGNAAAAKDTAGNGFAFAAHSLSLLLVVMIDRIAPSIIPSLSYIDTRYLLLFAYSGAIYSLGVAVLEPMRPRLFSTAKEARSFTTFLTMTEARTVAIPLAVLALAAVLVTLATSAVNGFGDPASFDRPARDVLTVAGLLAFFTLFLLLAYFQTYFLSRREFGPVFLGWGAAFTVRCAALSMPRLDLYLAVSSLAPFVAIAILFVIGARNTGKLK